MKKVVSMVVLGAALAVLAGCSGHEPPTIYLAAGPPPLDRLLDSPRRVMWVAAHPDDEGFSGPILAKAGIKSGGELYYLVLTDAAGGECCIPGGCVPDLATVRDAEIASSAKLYGATLQHEMFWNAPLPGSSFPPRHVIAERWRERADPTLVIAKAIREFRPEIILTLGPRRGGSGHPEHQLSARFTMAAVRLAATDAPGLPGKPHRVEHFYFVLNKLWLARWLGAEDPESVNETFDLHQPCLEGMSCREVAMQITRVHQSQANDMKGMRYVLKQLDVLSLHRVDPFTEILDPYEPVAGGGMGKH